MPEKIQSSVDLVRAVRNAGFDMICGGQHYLSDPYQMSSLFPLLARLAAEAGDMEIGSAVVLLPLHNPVELAESVATMDSICGGRFIFGIGLGYRDEEYTAFGVDRTHRVQRMEEALEVMKRLWTRGGGRVSRELLPGPPGQARYPPGPEAPSPHLGCGQQRCRHPPGGPVGLPLVD